MNALVATSIAIAILSGLAQQYATQRVEVFRQGIGTAQGQQLGVLGVAINAYIAQNFRTLVGQTTGILAANGTACAVANQFSPTVAELKTCGFLTLNFNATNYFSGGYQTNLSQFGTCPTNCTIIGTAALTNAILRNNAVDTSAINSAMQAIGADGGFSKSGAGATIVGQNAGWNTANPITGQPAGVLAIRIGTQSTLYNTYYARDGRLPLTAALQMGGNQITNLLAVTSGTTACTTKGDIAVDATTGAPAYCDGAKYQAIAGATAANWAATYAALPACNVGSKGQIYTVMTPTVGTGARAYACNGSGAWQPMAVDDTGNLTVAGNLSANTVTPTLVVADNSSCAGYNPGAEAQSSVTQGLILSCQSGVWRQSAQGARAWVNFDGTNCGSGWCAIRSGFNVSGVWRGNTGLYTVIFSAPMHDAFYTIVGTAGNTGMTDPYVKAPADGTVPTTDSASFYVVNNFTPCSGCGHPPVDEPYVFINFFGN